MKNKHQENDYWVRFNCPEFTSLCPITGQPDFAEIRISYVPDVRMVESKSLKLYLFSFRNHGDFHEDCVNIIMKDLIKLMEPKYIEVIGLFTPRGGISIFPLQTTESLELNMKKWQKQGLLIINKTIIIFRDLCKSPLHEKFKHRKNERRNDKENYKIRQKKSPKLKSLLGIFL